MDGVDLWMVILDFLQKINAGGGKGLGNKIDVGGYVGTSWIPKSM